MLETQKCVLVAVGDQAKFLNFNNHLFNLARHLTTIWANGFDSAFNWVNNSMTYLGLHSAVLDAGYGEVSLKRIEEAAKQNSLKFGGLEIVVFRVAEWNDVELDRIIQEIKARK